MLSAWLLPEHIADVLPTQARRIEDLRRGLLDRARAYGFELVMPPLLEHLESLLSGTGGELDLRTFKLVDQLSGRTLGLRADLSSLVDTQKNNLYAAQPNRVRELQALLDKYRHEGRSTPGPAQENDPPLTTPPPRQKNRQ